VPQRLTKHILICNPSRGNKPTWIRIQTIRLKTRDTIPINNSWQVPTSLQPSQRRLFEAAADCIQTGSNNATTLPNEQYEPPKKKKKRVHFSDDCAELQTKTSYLTPVTTSVATVQISRHVFDENSNVSKVSHYLDLQILMPEPAFPKPCLGSLETPNMFKHVFYEAESHPHLIKHSATHLQIVPISTLMSQSSGDELDLVDQLKLAHQAAIGVLQHGPTKWLSRRWTWEDLAFFKFNNNLSDEALQTLHLKADIPHCNHSITQNNVNDGSCIGKTNNNTASEYIDDYVNNITLFSLGIALLEVAYWKPISELLRDSNENIFAAARRLSNGRFRLGRRYQRVVQQCLQCNFGFGTDLNKPELQSAVYVCDP
jgi:hypothetical protein